MIIIRSFTAKIFIQRRAHLGAWLSTVASRGAGRSWARTLSWSHHHPTLLSSFCFFSFNFSSFWFFHSRSVAGKSSQGYRTAWPLAQHQSLECLPQSQKGNQTHLWHMLITKRQSNMTCATFGFQVDSCPRWSWASPCPPPQPHRPAHIHPPLLLLPQGGRWCQ